MKLDELRRGRRGGSGGRKYRVEKFTLVGGEFSRFDL